MTYTKKDLTYIALALYGARAALPTAGEAYHVWLLENARAVMLADLSAAIERVRGWLDSGRERIAERRAELDAAPHAYARESAQERLDWHMKSQKKNLSKMNHYVNLHQKIRLHGMPPADAFDVLDDERLRNTLRRP